jgi:hypothetical protein
VQDFEADLQDDLLARPSDYYVNVHTRAYPDGAVRGQLELALRGAECPATVEPEVVVVGNEFVVAADFGGYAEVHMVRGTDAPLPEDSEPVAVIPEGESPLRVSFTAQAEDVGSWTAWALRPEIRGCAGWANLTIVAAPPDTAMGPGRLGLSSVLGALLLLLGLAAAAPWIGWARRSRDHS